jgi:hypothetical protein
LAVLIDTIDQSPGESAQPDDIVMEPKLLVEQYLKTASALVRVARSMADQTIADRLKALAEDYERRAEQALMPDAAGASTHLPMQPAPAEK